MKIITTTQRSFLTTFLAFAIVSNCNSQIAVPDWSTRMQDRSLTFDQIIQEHTQMVPEMPVEPGQGYKQMERFRWLYESRLKDNGNIPDGDDVIHQWMAIKDYNQSRSLAGNWYASGPILDTVTTRDLIPGVGRVTSVAFHPTNPDILLAGSPAGGLWRSLDGGQTWSTNTDQLPTLGISSIAFDPSNPDIIYAGTGDRDASDSPGMGVIKSIDGGQTWELSNTGISTFTVGCIRIQEGTGHIFAATSNGIQKSINGGQTWTSSGPNSGNYKDLEFHPTNNQIIYTSVLGRFYRTENGGATWTWISDVLGSSTRMCIAVTPAAPDFVYVIRANTTSFSGFFKSEDGGATFTTMSTTPNILGWAADGSSTGGQAWYDLCLEADHINPEVVYLGGIRAKKSIDGGATWLDISNNFLHVDMHEMAISPHTKNLYLCNDGGLYRYLDNQEWKDISSGMVIGQIYQFGQSNHSPNHSLSGFQDNGTMEFNGVFWKRRGGGDGFESAYDFTDPAVWYNSIYYGVVYRTNSQVNNEKICGLDVLDVTEDGAWNTPYFLLKSDTTANTMFVGLKNLWRSTNIKHSEKDSIVWEKISNNLYNNTTNINELESSLSNPDIVFLAKDNRRLFRTNNANGEVPVWVNITNNLPVFQVPINSIETHPTDTNIVYICFHNDVYKSVNQGLNWTLLTSAFPDVSTNTIVMDTTNAEIEALYLGTDMGVYYKDNTMTEFIPFNQGMPISARVTELEIYYGATPSEHRIKASTYGRGLWESDLNSPDVNEFPAVASIVAADGGNEAFGSFDVNIIFYKNLNETNVTGFDNLLDDIWTENAVINSITGGPSHYVANVIPTDYGSVKLMVPHAAAIEDGNIPTFRSDTLKLVYAEAPQQLGSKGPGGVGDLNSMTFWLRADQMTNTIGAGVQSWSDINGSDYFAVQNNPLKMPELVSGTEGISGQKALEFDGEDDVISLYDVVPGRSISAFVMVETDTIKFNDHGWFASSRQPNGYLMHPWKNDFTYHNEVIDVNGDYSGTNSFYIGDASAPHIYGFSYHQDDLHQVMTTFFDEQNYPQTGVNIGPRDNTTSISIDIGHDDGYEDSRFGKGRIAEHFVYNNRLMVTHQRLIRNYMAARYEVDLGPSSRYHHPMQREEVFGIGKETAYDYHAEAQGLGIIKLMNPSSMDAGDYLMLGNDDETLEFAANLYPFLSNRTNRTWGFSETGEPGSVTVRVDMTAFPDPSGLGLIITEDNEFMPGSQVTFVPLLIQGPVMEAIVDFPANGVFTIGTQPILNTENISYATAKIFPNPASDMINVQLKNSWPQKWNVMIHNTLGQVVSNANCSGKSAVVNVDQLSSGIYFVSVEIDGKVVSREKIQKNN